MALPNNVFTGYSPDKLLQLAKGYGYNEANLDSFGRFLEENPARAKQYFDQQNMDMFGADKMRQFQQGGVQLPDLSLDKTGSLYTGLDWHQNIGNLNEAARAGAGSFGFTAPTGPVPAVVMGPSDWLNQTTGKRTTVPAFWKPPSADWVSVGETHGM